MNAHEGAAGLLSVELDETVGVDRYNGGETEDAGGNANIDDGPGLAQVSTAVSGGLTNLFTIGGSYGSDRPRNRDRNFGLHGHTGGRPCNQSDRH